MGGAVSCIKGPSDKCISDLLAVVKLDRQVALGSNEGNSILRTPEASPHQKESVHDLLASKADSPTEQSGATSHGTSMKEELLSPKRQDKLKADEEEEAAKGDSEDKNRRSEGDGDNLCARDHDGHEYAEDSGTDTDSGSETDLNDYAFLKHDTNGLERDISLDEENDAIARLSLEDDFDDGHDHTGRCEGFEDVDFDELADQNYGFREVESLEVALNNSTTTYNFMPVYLDKLDDNGLFEVLDPIFPWQPPAVYEAPSDGYPVQAQGALWKFQIQQLCTSPEDQFYSKFPWELPGVLDEYKQLSRTLKETGKKKWRVHNPWFFLLKRPCSCGPHPCEHVRVSTGLHPFCGGEEPRVWKTDGGRLGTKKEQNLRERGLQITKRRFGVENVITSTLPEDRQQQAITACQILRENKQDFRVQEFWRYRSEAFPYENYVLVVLSLSSFVSTMDAGN